MKRNKRPLPPLTLLRRERLEARVALHVLAAESGLPTTLLSRAERGLGTLTAEEEKTRAEALQRLQA